MSDEPGRDGVEEAGELLAYELQEWALEKRAMLWQFLADGQTMQLWRGTTLLVDRSLKEVVSELIEEVEKVVDGPPDFGADVVAYAIKDLPGELQDQVVMSLEAISIPYKIDSEGDLVVRSEDEERTEVVLSELLAPLDQPRNLSNVEVQEELGVARQLTGVHTPSVSSLMETKGPTMSVGRTSSASEDDSDFIQGTHIVGQGVAAGVYRFYSKGDCYWKRLKGFKGELDDILASGNASGYFVVEILPSDRGFALESDRRIRAVRSFSDVGELITPSSSSIPSGIYVVGEDIKPGLYQLAGDCYWARLSGFTGESKHIIANDTADGPFVVEIDPTDVGFELECFS